jgi:hypothetical protein
MVFRSLYVKDSLRGELAIKARNGPHGEGSSSGPRLGHQSGPHWAILASQIQSRQPECESGQPDYERLAIFNYAGRILSGQP